MNTPLHGALSNKNFDIANLLILNGANQSAVNNDDKNPWQLMHFMLDRYQDDI